MDTHRLRLTCDQNHEFECRQFTDECGVGAHGNRGNSYCHERRVLSQEAYTRIDEHEQALDL
jgi:hypothetical protein